MQYGKSNLKGTPCMQDRIFDKNFNVAYTVESQYNDI